MGLDRDELTVRPGTASRPRLPTSFERGTPLGRYMVVDVLGRGGMGVVYAAYDPELDRKVAIKLLQGRRTDDQAYLLREAHALARLSHPNVIAVHDVGTLPGDRVFVAMEYVHGGTLRDWLKREPRTWREVLPIMRAAGAGLVAAHSAGLVHRDFKPDNVLVGHDGRVRVMDFGLARLAGDATSESGRELPVGAKTPLSDQLTLEGMVVGTPAYMAPELYDAKPAGPTSDQFSFGVTLYEALYGIRPFADGSRHVEQPRPKSAPSIPARIERAVMRAIAIDPAERFPSIEALLAELSHVRRSRAIWSTAAGAVVAATATLLIVRVTAADPVADPCSGGTERVAAVWDPPIKQRVRAGLLAAQHGRPSPILDHVEQELDRYATDWVAARQEVCEATHVRHDQSDTMFDLRMRCLSERLEGMRALESLFAGADAATALRAPTALQSLPRSKDCVTLTLGESAPPNPIQAAQLDQLVRQRAEVSAHIYAGQYESASTKAANLLPRTTAIGYEPATAVVLLMSGVALAGASRFSDAERDLRAAAASAARARDDNTLAHVWTYLVFVIGTQPTRYAEAIALSTTAEIAILRSGGEPDLDADLAYNVGTVHAVKGEFEKATKAFEHAIELRRSAMGDADLTKLYVSLGNAYLKSGNVFGAKAAYEKGLTLAERRVNSSDDDLALALGSLGMLKHAFGDYQGAFELHHRALGIMEELHGPGHEQVAQLVYSLGMDNNGREDYRGAIPYYERAVALFEALSPDHPVLGLALVGLADCREEVGDARRAVGEAERGLRLLETTSARDLVQLSVGRYALAKALWSSNRDKARARTLMVEARKGFLTGGFGALNGVAATEKWLAKMNR